MGFLNIKPVARSGAKTVIGLAATSGEGKTFSAILLAYGMAKRNAKKVGLLDTENGRGLLYSDILPNGEQFLHAHFGPPFSPSRYIDAIREFEAAGVEVLIMDSVTHEWEGTGGCEEIATEGNPKIKRWNLAKLEHKRFMNALLQSSMHIIVCIRAREKVKMVYGAGGKVEYEPLGLMPVQEKNFMFEMTASLLMRDQGRAQEVMKCPAALQGILGRGKDYLTIDDGEALRAWIDGGAPVNKAVASNRAKLAEAAENGVNALRAAWDALPPKMKKELQPELDGFKSSAAGFDRQREVAAGGDESEASQAVNAAISGGGGDDGDIYGPQ